MTMRVVADLSELPTSAFGSKSPVWWGTLGFIALEGMGFALAIAMYFYLAATNPVWPLGAPPPDLFWGTVMTAVLVASLVPNHMTMRWARQVRLDRVRLGMVLMSIAGLLPLVVRIFEFRTLNVNWDSN